MTKTPYFGELEDAVLLAILQLEEPEAVPIRALLEERTGRPAARGALDTALERLDAKGYLRSRMGETTDGRAGRPRRHFSVTPAGLRAIKSTHGVFASLTRGLDPARGP